MTRMKKYDFELAWTFSDTPSGIHFIRVIEHAMDRYTAEEKAKKTAEAYCTARGAKILNLMFLG